jgi:mRNA-degrading endonuclease RelE of RelBE toxin-antitoxin system
LGLNPYPADSKRIVNTEEKVFRIRLGKYRIQYQVKYDTNIILISKIGKRDKFYQD